jgi:pyruvate,water dikinase
MFPKNKTLLARIPGFKEKFDYFEELLRNNEETHNAMGELSEALSSGLPFSSGFANSRLKAIFEHTENMARLLCKMEGEKYSPLLNKIREIRLESEVALEPRIKCPDGLTCPDITCDSCDKIEKLYIDTPYVINIKDVTDKEQLYVGAKMARLGEIKNILKIPVPEGFCLTVRIFEDIMSIENIRKRKNFLFDRIDFNNAAKVNYACRQVQALIISSLIPERIENTIIHNYESIFGGRSPLLAVRSSAFGEDSEKYSFAGLHRSVLNVPKEYLFEAVLDVIISVYSPQSVIYRYLSGIRDEDMPMCVGCIEMVDARTAGVLYTIDPNRVKEGMIIEAASGLGNLVVDGQIKPQEFNVKLSANGLEIDFHNSYDGVTNNETDTRTLSHLSKAEIETLFDYAKRIEAHYGLPQDIEWAVDKSGAVYILQARPLKLSAAHETNQLNKINIQEIDSKYTPIITTGECASIGAASGKVVQIRTTRDISKIPYGSVVVAKKSMIELTTSINKIAAIITEVGSTTGHLAIIAREFQVPMLTNVQKAFEILNDGMLVTVDAGNSRVYPNILEEFKLLFNRGNQENLYKKSSFYQIWSKLSKYLFELNLTSPDSSSFTMTSCKTLHDIIRFIHETAMRSMFSLNRVPGEGAIAFKLDIGIPLVLYIIDLGGGVKSQKNDVLTASDIASQPMLALIEGMTNKDINWSGFIELDSKGFAEIVLGNAADSNLAAIAMNNKSYAIVSDKYLNFSSQLGFHFSKLDAYASAHINKNYINFNFRGGAASMERRSRRATAVSRILEALDFSTVCQEDNVNARIRNITKENIYGLITEIGRLMGALRNADAAMLSEQHADDFVKKFLKGSKISGN